MVPDFHNSGTSQEAVFNSFRFSADRAFVTIDVSPRLKEISYADHSMDQ